MHRVISTQVFQSQNEESETINKRLCCSFLLTTAFLSIIGGFLLGRFTTEKAMLIRQNRLCGAEDEKRINDITTNLSNTIKAFIIISRAPELLNAASEVSESTSPPQVSEVSESTSPFEVSELQNQLYAVLKCQNNYSLPLPSLNEFKTNVQQYSNNMLNIQIDKLTNCINNATMYVQQIIKIELDNP